MVTVEQARKLGVTFGVAVEEQAWPSPEEDAQKGLLPAECVQGIRARLDDGDSWAWGDVCVSAEWRGFRGESYLRCCSYVDEADFRRGGYLPQKEEEALEALGAALAEVAARGQEAQAGVSLLG